MKPNTNINLDAIVAPVAKFFHRFHTILFFLIMSIGLFLAIVILLTIIEQSGQTGTPSSELISNSFDQSTIDKIESLESREASKPGDRPSPFVE